MLHALYTASSGMQAQQMNIDTIAHNLANVNTTGFKKARLDFQDLIYINIKQPTVTAQYQTTPVGLSVGLGVRSAATQTLFSEGNLVPTGNPFDLAITGNAFFKVEVPGRDEPLYTKDGSFKIDSEGNLVTTDGYKLVGVEALEPEATDISISTDGSVTYKLPGQNDRIEAGRIELAKFINPAGLEKLGRNLYAATAASGEAIDWDPESDSSITIEQGYLESSNVQVVEEMINMITAQRAYEINSKVIQASDEMLGMANNLRR
ncbi:MAG: flagellar basal-body rod protein FlgG [Firmicutes bacterium]|nr:flagellar basal-body rod protein FlgG [Bacillota bacterium]